MRALFLAVLLLFSVNAYAVCPNTTDAAVPWAAASTGTSVTQGNVTWTFSGTVTCGLYANGDPWVVDGSWTIDSITPDIDATAGAQQNGAMVNPTNHDPQGFSNNGDTKVGNFSASANITLPYQASEGESIVKSIGIGTANPSVCTSNGNCITEIQILTVLASAPPGDGADYFRPPYAGTTKTSYQVSTARLDLLPTLDIDDTPTKTPPTLAATASIFNNVRFEMSSDPGNGDNTRRLRPTGSFANTATQYGVSIANQNTKAMLRLMGGDVTTSTPAFIYLMQAGIDSLGAMTDGLRWRDGSGHEPGHLTLIAFAATLLEDTAAQTLIASITNWHEDRYLAPNNSGTIVFGSNTSYSGSTVAARALAYWNYVANNSSNLEYKDPYGQIDGGGRLAGTGSNQLNGYQKCCFSFPWKMGAFIADQIPEMQAFWPNYDELATYTERWNSAGGYTQPDTCAPLPAALVNTTITAGSSGYGTTWGDVNGSCVADSDAGDGTGRFPNAHGTSVDAGTYRDDWSDEMYDLYYGANFIPPISLSSVTPNQGTQNTVVPIALVGSALDGASPSIAVSGANVTSDTPVCSSANNCTANITVAAGAAVGARNLTFTTVAGTTNALTFTVVASTVPTLSSISPNSSTAGQVVNFTLTGTNFDSGNADVNSSSGDVTILTHTVVNATTITGQLSIAEGNALSAEISVTTDTGTTGTAIFTVNPVATSTAGRGRLTMLGGK